jgi:simple sugar transport system permease protein
LFDQPAVTYIGYALVPFFAWWTYRTHAGLAVRAVGYAPEAALAAGIAPRRIQMLAVVAGGVLGGIGGATLVLVQVGTFAEGMSAGRGFVAIAVVALGRWRPLGTALAALGFGAASAVQYLVQAMGWHAPYQLFLAIPYVATLVAMVLRRGQDAGR